MNTITLSPRLAAVAKSVPAGARLIDVGTDHAMLPVYLAQTGRIAHAFASDIRPGPLTAARALVAKTGTGDVIDLRLTDGLCGFTRPDGDTVTIAGMGGETMTSILSAAPWVRDGVLLILAPQSKPDVLRRYLAENGMSVTHERLVRDAGRLYPLLLARAGQSPKYTPAELHTGLLSQIGGDPLFGAYLDTLMRRAAAAAPYDPEKAALLRAYQSMKERLEP